MREWFERRRTNEWPSAEQFLQFLMMNVTSFQFITRRTAMKKKQIGLGGESLSLSLSKAELLLVRSWSARQKVVYHILKLVSKAVSEELGTKSVLKTYHFKTLMLRKCEETSKDWSEGSGVIFHCHVEILTTMMECLQKRSCKNYFIENNNMFSQISDNGAMQT